MAMEFKYRILVVDDDPKIRNVTAVILQMNNYDVSSAENGIAAIPILKKTRPHVMISDLSMPDMDGHELLRMARRFFPAMGAIVVSAFDGAEASDGDVADAVFTKGDYDVQDLLECVSDLAGHYPLRQANVKTAVSPSWIPHNGGRNFWAACNECLTCFSLPLSQVGYSGIHRAYCPSCGQKIRFMMQQMHSDVVAIAA